MFNKKPVRLTDKNSYIGQARCIDCGFNQQLRVPKGKRVIEYANKIKCSECGNNHWRVVVY